MSITQGKVKLILKIKNKFQYKCNNKISPTLIIIKTFLKTIKVKLTTSISNSNSLIINKINNRTIHSNKFLNNKYVNFI